MKLLSFNVHAWQEEDQLRKIADLAADIAKERYDVIALQEVSQRIDSPLVDSNLREDNYGLVLLKELERLGVTDYSLHWTQAHIGFEVYEEGVAIITRHKVTDVQELFTTTSRTMDFWKTRRIIRTEIKVNNEDYTFYSGHFGWWNDEEEPFKDQWERLVETVQPDQTTFVMGDLNNDALVRAEGYDYVLSDGFYDTYILAEKKDDGLTITGEIAGWEGNKAGRRIDYILVNKRLTVQSSFVRFDGKETPILSDHAGVVVEI
ncbi:endonuclease/exonuclease/phosphatase family protein [Mangrovibacillus cuniculi]|uniref:Endonuclease/exonuclease/phosphatase family protein n=1 Tax=Mangrovibacillus cuniculi TaxID=2593652 RepID=A0A7S8HGH0_9BACI|nr:endonuclease/exonuclease/phosphatase family protein [Mangrovibacillus cuniculi]QPC47797.1 endonuclease/exonuclease/phosphatase family protein [Mangrovibacillus cuniculi]